MQTRIEKPIDNYLKTALRRFSLFAITYLIALISLFGINTLFFAFLFPIGLSLVIFDYINFHISPSYHTSPMAWLIVGYAIYISVSLIGIMVKNRYVFIAVYIIFIFLLITNVVSCREIGSGLN